MRLLAIWLVLFSLPLVAAAEDGQLPQPPDGLVELRWSSDFAVFVARECAQFEMEETAHPRLTEFMERLISDGVDLQNYETVYAETPAFDGESVKWLFARSALNGVIYPDNIPFCGIAEDVYTSDMLTGAMLRRVQPVGNS